MGLLGGTFDPPHIGHLIAASQVKSALDLDALLLVVANDPWQKSESRQISATRDRLQMARAAVGDCRQAGIEASDVEIALGGPSYTYDTLRHLKSANLDTEYLIVVGSDTASQLDTWHQAEDLKGDANFAIVNRPGVDVRTPTPGWRYQTVEIPPVDVSSTLLRSMVRDRRPIDFLTTRQVIQHIEARELYREGA